MAPSPSSSFSMECLIPIINELQEVFSAAGAKAIELPQIVVVGAQSSGKSSVLESLVGKSFLPRGAGLVTRCPIVLRLIHTSSSSSKSNGKIGEEEYVEFQHRPAQKFTDFDAVRAEIESETTRKAGSNMNIVNDPILLTVYSSNIVTLTVVDLPGIVKVPTGDQPLNIEDQIRTLIQEYIDNPNSIILAVSAASNDMATSESLKYARDTDPEGNRTLAIVTKLDLMDKGTDAVEVLSGATIPVKLGIIGVVNRSQQDIKDNKSVEDALKDEAEFLSKNYASLATKNGTPYLAKTLNTLLMAHIGKCLPDLEIRIRKQLNYHESKLAELGGANLPEDKSYIMIELINRFVASYKAAIDGSKQKLQTKYLCGGAKIRSICQTKIDELLTKLTKEDEPTDDEILLAIQNSKGFESNLDPQDAFQSLVKDQIGRLTKPTLEGANLVHAELQQIVHKCITADIQRYPAFSRALIQVVNDMWNSTFKSLKAELCKYLQMECSYINTDHEDFIQEAEAYKEQVLGEEKKKGKENNTNFVASTNSLKLNVGASASSLIPFNTNGADQILIDEKLPKYCEMTKTFIRIYLRLVLKNLKDHFRKALAHHRIYHAMDRLNSELIMKLFKPEGRIEELIQESPVNVQARNETIKMIQSLERATEIIERTRSNIS